MLPALTATRRRLPTRRIAMGAASSMLAIGAVTASVGTAAPRPDPSIAEALRPSTWALTVPSAWLAAPLPRVRAGDLVDILAVRQGDKAYAVPVAYAARVMSTDERGFVLETDADSASAIVIARGSGLLLVPLLRSAR